MRMQLLLKNGTLLTMAKNNNEVGDLLIKDGKIANIAPKITLPHTTDLKIIDLQGKTVLPGIIESHCHIGITEERKIGRAHV